MKEFLKTIEELEALYGTPGSASLVKVADRMTRSYRAWIKASKFCVLTTVGPEGTDGSPRGDEGPVARELDERTLALPDWHGNNRMDSLRNIVRDGRISLMFMVPGSNSVVRVNGVAKLSIDADLLQSFEHKGRQPRSVIVITIKEIYFQCARALLRAGLWNGDHSLSKTLPSPGEILSEMTDGVEDGEAYDKAWPERAAKTMW